jgi:hypothetical protein
LVLLVKDLSVFGSIDEIGKEEARGSCKNCRPTRKNSMICTFIKYYCGNKVKFNEWKR